MSKLIKKYKENYRNFLGIFKGLFEHTGVQLAKYNTHTQERGGAKSILEKKSDGNYILMHTNSAYPAKDEELNLRMIGTLRKRYDCLVGYSGHEQNLEGTVIACALGARVIERHITLDHDMWGTDQAASLTVHAMDMLRRRIEVVFKTLGTGEKTLCEDELKVRKKLRG